MRRHVNSCWVLIVLLFPLVVSAEPNDPDLHCHQVEGKKLPHCTRQAKPTSCGQPKPCPPCPVYKSCGTQIVAEMDKQGTCAVWGVPECHQEGDRQVCTPAPCLHENPPACNNVSKPCGREGKTAPGKGTYSCSVQACGCEVPPGYVYCGTVVTCSSDQYCGN